MNLLAHALLAAPDSELMFGGLIGDFVRGRIDAGLPSQVRAGVALHRAIDVYTDAHPETSGARALFAPPLRRYAGILLDVWFDHLLALDWPTYGEGTLDDFSRRVRDTLDAYRDLVPERMRGFVAYLRANDLPAAYRDEAVIGDVLRGMSRRLSRENPLGEALPSLVALDAPVARHFRAFFPQLQAFAASERDRFVRDV
jgi:acyl carrier protein phosphodiesterase